MGDAKKARFKLGWKSKTNIKTLIKEMMQEDLKTVSRSLYSWVKNKIYIAGQQGMVGSAVMKLLIKKFLYSAMQA